jgi:hypothetical protein
MTHQSVTKRSRFRGDVWSERYERRLFGTNTKRR